MKFGACVMKLNTGDRVGEGLRKIILRESKKLQKLKKIKVRGIRNTIELRGQGRERTQKIILRESQKMQKLKKNELRGIPNEQSEKPEPLVTWRAKGLLFPRKFKKIAKLKKLHDIFASAMR